MKIAGPHTNTTRATQRATRTAETSAPADRFQPAGEKEWTLLFYNAGQGHLSSMTAADILDLERVGSDENTNVVAANYAEPHGLWSGQRPYEGALTYFVTKQQHSDARDLLGDSLGSLANVALATPAAIKSPVTGRLAGPGEASKMSDPETLRAFVLDSMKKYPAKNFALVITGHGAAFQGQAITRDSEGKHAISNDALGQVLEQVKAETGQGVGVVNLNTCYSGNLESLYPLGPGTDVVVASQGELALNTQPFAAVLSILQDRLAAGSKVGPQELATMFVQEAKNQPLSDLYSPTLSATDTGKLRGLGQAVSDLQKACMEAGVPAALLRECVEEAVSIDFSRSPRSVALADLGSLAKAIQEKVGDPEIKLRAKSVTEQLSSAVIAEQHSGQADESFLGKAVRRIPFLVGRQKDVTGAGGLTVFWQNGETERQALISDSAYGKAHPIEQFMNYLAG